MSLQESSIIFERYEVGIKKYPFYAVVWTPGELSETAKLGSFRNLDDLMADLKIPSEHKVKIYNEPISLIVNAISTADSRDYQIIAISKRKEAVKQVAVKLDLIYVTTPEEFIKTVKNIAIKI